MALWALHVNDADNKVHNYADDGNEARMGDTPAGMTEYTGVEIAEEPEIGATYDGVTYTPIAKTDYFDVESPLDTALAHGSTIQVPADGVTSKTLHVQKKKGSDDTDMVGTGEVVKVLPSAIIKDRKSTRLNSSHSQQSRMPSSA